MDDIKVERKVLQKAINKWGTYSQFQMVKEECMELALAIHKYDRADKVKNEKELDDVIDETADVLIMMEQMKLMLPVRLIQKRIDFKLERLEERIKE